MTILVIYLHIDDGNGYVWNSYERILWLEGQRVMNLSMCSSWLCTRNDKEKIATPSRDQSSSVVTSGPGPSPGSSTSCDDVVPPPKNCYRLVVLGNVLQDNFSYLYSSVI